MCKICTVKLTRRTERKDHQQAALSLRDQSRHPMSRGHGAAGARLGKSGFINYTIVMAVLVATPKRLRAPSRRTSIGQPRLQKSLYLPLRAAQLQKASERTLPGKRHCTNNRHSTEQKN